MLLLKVIMLSVFPRGLDGVITSTSALALFRLDRDGSRYDALRVRMGAGRLGDRVCDVLVMMGSGLLGARVW